MIQVICYGCVYVNAEWLISATWTTYSSTELGAAMQDSVKQVLLLVSAVEQLFTEKVVYVEQVVSVFTSVLHQLIRQWSVSRK